MPWIKLGRGMLMKSKKFKLIPLILLMGLGLLQGPTFAWEFNLNGSSGYVYQYYSQGQSGFFGPFNVDLGAGTGGLFHTNNSWLGLQVNNIVSGADASRSNLSTLLFPQIKVTPAVALEGVYRIGNNDTDTFPGGTVAFAVGEWLQWWVSANTPMGLVGYGKRPFYVGCGLQFDASNRTQEHLAMVSYYGPLTIGLGIYPWRTVPDLTEAGDFAGTLPWNNYDKSSISSTDMYGLVDYSAGPLDVGIAALWYRYHVGAEMGNSIALQQGVAPLDSNVTEGAIYMKYNNGRFFFNAETDWYYRDSHFSNSYLGTFLTGGGAVALPMNPGDGSGSPFRPQYTEWWRYMVELGAICGPAKLSLLYSYVPGPDRRHGVLIDKQSALVDLYRPNNIIFSHDHSNNTVFRPYSIIFVGDYGSGLGAVGFPNVIGRTGDGYVVDASVLAARVDHAVASNLNLFASFLYATRVSHGYGWGYIKPDGVGGATINGAINFANPATSTFAAPSPSIPDNGLGWELDLGLSWNLLENWNLGLTAGYWQPGKWFGYACISRSVVGWDAPGPGNNWGVDPGRSIDPVFALISNLTVSF
jgi:hypothetical protein